MITGASSGLGAEFAAQLAARGHDLVLVSRDAARLEQVAAPLRARHGVHVEVLAADLGDRAELERVRQRIMSPTGSGPVDVLVNNAGYGMNAEIVDSRLSDQETMHAVMTTAVLVLSHAAATVMREQRRGAIINVSSVAAFISRGTYSAAKAWVLVFSESLAAELRGTGVTVTSVNPGYTRTEFHERAAMDVSGLPAPVWLRTELVVHEALAAARRGQVSVTPSALYAAVAGLADVLPRGLVNAVVSRAPYPGRARSSR